MGPGTGLPLLMGPMVFAQGNVASDDLKLSEPVPSLDKAQRGLGALLTTFIIHKLLKVNFS